MKKQRSKPSWTLPVEADLNFCDLIEAKMFNSRVISINGEIEECGAGLMTNQLQVLAECNDEITLLITSNGGAVDAGGAIIRAIRYAQEKGCRIIGEVRGYTMSMATIVLQACDVRLAAPEDVIMVHGFSGASIGDAREAEANMKLRTKWTEIYSKFYAERSTAEDTQYHNEKYWVKLLKDALPHYMFGYEALEKGLLDAIID